VTLAPLENTKSQYCGIMAKLTNIQTAGCRCAISADHFSDDIDEQLDLYPIKYTTSKFFK